MYCNGAAYNSIQETKKAAASATRLRIDQKWTGEFYIIDSPLEEVSEETNGRSGGPVANQVNIGRSGAGSAGGSSSSRSATGRRRAGAGRTLGSGGRCSGRRSGGIARVVGNVEFAALVENGGGAVSLAVSVAYVRLIAVIESLSADILKSGFCK